MNGRAIPGYYFDPEKQKYFKILPNHAAPPGSQYSRDNVRQLKEGQRKRKRDEEQRRRVAQQRVQRHKALLHPLIGSLGVDRELGIRDDSESYLIRGSHIYTSAWTRRRILGPRQPFHERYKIPSFARDPLTGAFFLGATFEGKGDLRSLDTRKALKSGGYDFIEDSKSMLGPLPSQISSVSIGRQRSLLATTLGDFTQPSIHLTKLLDPEQIESDILETGAILKLEPREEMSLWTSRASPCDETFAIGTSAGLIILEDATRDWTTQRTVKFSTDVFSVDFLSSSTVAAGLRDGSVHLYDQRSSGTALRLRHPSAITGMRCFDEFKLVACGLRNSLRSYDLRYLPRTFHKQKQTSRPYLTYSYHNEYRTGLGFDIDRDLGLIAAASDSQQIQLFALHTGEEVESAALREPLTDFPQCVQFSSDQTHLAASGSLRTLFVSSGSTLGEFHW